MRASPVTSPYQYDRKFPNLLSCYLQPTSPLEALLSNYPTYSSPIWTLPLNWEGFYKNPFVWDRGLTQPQLGPFLNSQTFSGIAQVKPGRNRKNKSNQTKHEKQVKTDNTGSKILLTAAHTTSLTPLYFILLLNSQLFSNHVKNSQPPPLSFNIMFKQETGLQQTYIEDHTLGMIQSFLNIDCLHK